MSKSVWYRFNADDYYWEVVNGKGQVVCKTTTESEAKEIINQCSVCDKHYKMESNRWSGVCAECGDAIPF